MSSTACGQWTRRTRKYFTPAPRSATGGSSPTAGACCASRRSALQWAQPRRARTKSSGKSAGPTRTTAVISAIALSRANSSDQLFKERSMAKPFVAILMGSDSDLDTMQSAVEIFDKLGIAREVRVLSAHRTPDATHAYVK